MTTTATNHAEFFTTWSVFNQAYGLLYKNLDQRMTKLGTSQAQAAVLVILKSVDGLVPLSHLARLLVQEPQSITSLVDRLEAQGLVRRVPSRQDRRVIHVELTPTGEQRFEQIGSATAEGLAEVLSALNGRELQTFTKSLRQLRTRGTDALHLDRRVFDEAERDSTFAPRDVKQPVGEG